MPHPTKPRTPREWRLLVEDLMAERNGVELSDELAARVAAALGNRHRTEAASSARVTTGIRKRRLIMFAALGYLKMNRDNPGAITKRQASEAIAMRLAEHSDSDQQPYEEVYELLGRLWPGRKWTHPPKPSEEDIGALFGDEDDGLWLFEVDLPPRRKRKPGNR